MKDGWVSQSRYSEVVGILPGLTNGSRNGGAPCNREESEAQKDPSGACLDPGPCQGLWVFAAGLTRVYMSSELDKTTTTTTTTTTPNPWRFAKRSIQPRQILTHTGVYLHLQSVLLWLFCPHSIHPHNKPGTRIAGVP